MKSNKHQQVVDALKQQVINEVEWYCRKINQGYNDLCYQDTLNKILFIEEDLNDIDLIF